MPPALARHASPVGRTSRPRIREPRPRAPLLEKAAMRILMLGGSGLLSGAALDAFLGAGHAVVVLTRGSRPLPARRGLTARTADRLDADSLAMALEGERFDFTADFLAFDAAGVERLLLVRGFEPGRIAMVSSGQVYLVTAEPRPPFREADADAALMPEPAPGTRDHAEWAYGMGKRAAEAALRSHAAAHGLDALALRLPVIQGERDGSASRRLWAWLERMRDGGPVLLPNSGAQRVRFLHAGDAARALVTLAGTSRWPSEPALNLAQPDECTLREFLEQVAEVAGLSPRFVSVDEAELARAGLADTCAPYWGRWCSRPDPAREYLPGVVRAHLAEPPASSHPGYAHRARERELAARLATG
jgi:nucleoside-diphosphate-sugar epimerase